MRIFIGIPPSDEIKAGVLQFQKEHSALRPIRWIRPENLHITLVPPWEIDNPEQVIKKLRKIEQKSVSTIRFQNISLGPQRKPRLIWLTGNKSFELEILKSNLFSVLEKEQEKRPFLPHLTVGRFNALEYNSIAHKTFSKQIFWTMQITEFVLYQSLLSPNGLEYRRLYTCSRFLPNSDAL